MKLTCPTCRSVLEIPDGTTALVRCPTCRGVFDPRKQSASAPPIPRATRKRPKPIPEREVATEPIPELELDDSPGPASQFLRDQEEKKLRIKEKVRDLRRSFRIAGIGCRILYISYSLFALALTLTMVFLIQMTVMAEPLGILILLAVICAFFGFLLSPIGLIIILFGPNMASTKGYASVGLMFAFLHFALVFVSMLKAPLFALAGASTQIPNLCNYMAAVFYPGLFDFLPGHNFVLLLAGVFELLQLIFTMVTLMCLARASGDDDLGIQCLKTAARFLFLFAFLVFSLLIFTTLMVQTGAIITRDGRIVFVTVWLAVRGIVVLMFLLPLRRSKEVMESCYSPLNLDLNMK